MENGKAIVPDITRAFWNHCSPDMGETFDHASSSFEAHTHSTGVFGGHGIPLFTERVEMGKQLINDLNPGIRAWAEEFVKYSERRLVDANRSSQLHKAMRATSE
jgi:hypothetical protein